MGYAEEVLEKAVKDLGAKCADDPDPEKWRRWYPPDTPKRFFEELCEGCPLIQVCDEYARQNPWAVGVYGGKPWRLVIDERILRDDGRPDVELIAEMSVVSVTMKMKYRYNR